MIPFAEIQFPPEISYGSKGGAMFSTSVISSNSGHEQRNINWSQARARYDVASGIKTEAQMNELISFFRARRGRAIGFRFKDWSDYRAKNQYIAKGDGRRKNFQLIKHYRSIPAIEEYDSTKEQYIYERIITKPVNNSYLKLYVNSQLIEDGGYSVDFATGIVKFDERLSNGAILTADFEFDVPVRFDTDHLDMQVDSFELGSWNNIPLVEIRV